MPSFDSNALDDARRAVMRPGYEPYFRLLQQGVLPLGYVAVEENDLEASLFLPAAGMFPSSANGITFRCLGCSLSHPTRLRSGKEVMRSDI